MRDQGCYVVALISCIIFFGFFPTSGQWDKLGWVGFGLWGERGEKSVCVLPDMKQQLKEYKLGKGVPMYVCIHERCVWGVLYFQQ